MALYLKKKFWMTAVNQMSIFSFMPSWGVCQVMAGKAVLYKSVYLFIWGFTSLSTLQVISRRVVGRAEETSTHIWSRFCTVNCWPMASNYQLSHLRLCRELNPGLRGGRRECYHSATVAPSTSLESFSGRSRKSCQFQETYVTTNYKTRPHKYIG